VAGRTSTQHLHAAHAVLEPGGCPNVTGLRGQVNCKDLA
jgi:hypothetical protein